MVLGFAVILLRSFLSHWTTFFKSEIPASGTLAQDTHVVIACPQIHQMEVHCTGHLDIMPRYAANPVSYISYNRVLNSSSPLTGRHTSLPARRAGSEADEAHRHPSLQTASSLSRTSRLLQSYFGLICYSNKHPISIRPIKSRPDNALVL
jgi:hypothetical protein